MNDIKFKNPLTFDFHVSLLIAALSAIFAFTFYASDVRQMDISISIALSFVHVAITGICWLTAKYYLKRIPYALVSAPVVLPIFWSIYAVILPMGYILGGDSFSVSSQELYLQTQFWVLIGTIMLCLGLSAFRNRFSTEQLSQFKDIELRKLYISWWILLILSFLQWIEFYLMGLLGRAVSYVPEPAPYRWVIEQLSALSPYALLIISVFIFCNTQNKLYRRIFLLQYNTLAAIMLIVIFLRAQYRWLLVVVYLIYVGYNAYYPYKLKRNTIFFGLLMISILPIINTMRTSGFINDGTGIEQFRPLFGDDFKRNLSISYFSNNNISKVNEFERAGLTWEFTAETIRMMPRYCNYFYGSLFLHNLRQMIPFMLWPSKYAEVNEMPETQINIRVRESDDDTGFGPIVFLWAEGGPIAVISGMFAFGLLYGYIYWKLVLKTQNALGIILYSFFALSLMELEADWIMSLLIPLRICLLIITIWYIGGLFPSKNTPAKIHKGLV